MKSEKAADLIIATAVQRGSEKVLDRPPQCCRHLDDFVVPDPPLIHAEARHWEALSRALTLRQDGEKEGVTHSGMADDDQVVHESRQVVGHELEAVLTAVSQEISATINVDLARHERVQPLQHTLDVGARSPEARWVVGILRRDRAQDPLREQETSIVRRCSWPSSANTLRDSRYAS